MAGRWRECRFQLAGRPLGIAFSGGRAGTAGTTETTGKWQAMLPHPAIGLCEARKPIPCAKRQVGAISVVPVVSAVPVAGTEAQSGLAPTWPPARRPRKAA